MKHRQSSAAACAALGAAVLGVTLLSILPFLMRPDLAVVPVPEFFLSGPPLPRCPSCGSIAAKREIAPKVYEYTLRMVDGSVSLFQETLPTTWHLGERMVVIEGTVALD